MYIISDVLSVRVSRQNKLEDDNSCQLSIVNCQNFNSFIINILRGYVLFHLSKIYPEINCIYGIWNNDNKKKGDGTVLINYARYVHQFAYSFWLRRHISIMHHDSYNGVCVKVFVSYQISYEQSLQILVKA